MSKKVKAPESCSSKKHAVFIKNIFKNQMSEKQTFYGGDIERAVFEYFYKTLWRANLNYYMQYRKIFKIYQNYIIIDETPEFMLIWDEYMHLCYFIEKYKDKYIRIWGQGVHIDSIRKIEHQDLIFDNEFGTERHPFFECMSEKWVDKLQIGALIYKVIRPVPVMEGFGSGEYLSWYKYK